MTVPSFEAKRVDKDGRAFLAPILAISNHWESVFTIFELKWYVLCIHRKWNYIQIEDQEQKRSSGGELFIVTILQP